MMVEGAAGYTRMPGMKAFRMPRVVWIYLIIGITLDQGSAVPMCMDGWEQLETGVESAPLICVHHDAVARTWDDAMASCRHQYGHLLPLNDGFHQISRNTFEASLYNYTQLQGGLNESWSAMRVQDERLWWMGEVPVDIYPWEAGFGVWEWSEPLDFRTGDCGMINLQPYASTTDVPFGVQLVSCHLLLPFICVNHGQTFTASPVSSCPNGWWGNIFLNSCLHYSGAGSDASHQDAQASCQTMSAELAILTSPNLHFMATDLLNETFWSSPDYDDYNLLSMLNPEGAGSTQTNPTTVEAAATASTLELWIGAEKQGEELYWVNGEVTPVEDARFDPTNQQPDTGCVTLDPELWTNQEWSVRSCDLELPSLCQLQADQQPSEPIVVLNPIDPSVTSFANVNADSVLLTCNATNYHPDMPVIWRTRDHYINNGLPPAGFQLDLHSAALDTDYIDISSPHWIQGYYSCEVWGYNPYQRYSSEQVLLTFNDIYTYQLSLTLHSLTYDPTWDASILLHILSIPFFIDETLMTTLAVLVFMPHLNIFPTFNITSLSEGSVVVEAMLYYTLDAQQHSTFLLYMGLSAEGYNNPDYLHLHTSAGMYDAIMQNIANIIDLATSGNLHTHYQIPVNDIYNLSSLTMDDVQLRSTVFCPARSTYDNWQVRYDWEVTPLGEMANSNQVCLSDGVALATSLCEGNYTTGGIWREIHYYTSCPPLDGSVITDDLQQLAEMVEDPNMVKLVAHELANLTSYADVMASVDVVYTSEILLAIANTPSPGIEIGNDIVSTVNNILALSGSVVEEAQSINQASTRMLLALDQYTQSANLSSAENHTAQFIQPRIALSISEVTGNTTGMLGYASSTMTDLTPEDVEVLTSVDDLDSSTKDTVIILPEEAVERAKQAKVMWEALVASTTDADRLAQLMASQVRISFTVYQNHQLFISPDQIVLDMQQQQEDGEEEAGQVTFLDANSRIIAGTVHGAAITDLQEPVKLLFYPLDANASSECGFWDTFAASGLGNWSTSGCSLAGEENGRLICLCDHLTNFAILASVTQDRISAVHQAILTFITVIGVSLSICGLFCTVLSFILFRKLRQGRAQKVLFNLALALLAVYVIFLVGIESTENEIACLTIAALLHYFLLVAFSWMLVESVIQYLKFVKVFNTYVSRFTMKTAVPAWVLPGVVVGAVAAIDHNLFRGPEQYCWLSLTAFYYAFLLPVGCIIIINTVLFTLVIKGITCDRPKGMQSTQSKKDLSILQLRAAITCFVLLGVTWVFGFLAINDGGFIFQYIFCVLNSLQGFLIFVFHNVQEKSVRDAWIQLCCNTTKPPSKQKYLSKDSAPGNSSGNTATSSEQRPGLPITYDNPAFKRI